MYIGIMSLINCFPLKVFESTVENVNHMVSNGLLVWVSFIFIVLQTQVEIRLT